MTRETERRDDPPGALMDAELRRAGHDPDCDECLLALALNGVEACTEHYRPVAERGRAREETR